MIVTKCGNPRIGKAEEAEEVREREVFGFLNSVEVKKIRKPVQPE